MDFGRSLASLDSWARRGPGRFLLLVAALTFAGSVLCLLLGLGLAAFGVFAEDSRFWRGDRPHWAGPTGNLVCLTGLALAGGGFWWLVRNGYYRRNARARRWARNRSRRRDLIRQVRGTATRRDEDGPTLPLVAEHLIDQPKFLLPLGGLGLLQIGQAFLRWAPGFVILAAIFVGAVTIGAVRSFAAARQARAFLAAHANTDHTAEARARR